MSSILFYCAYLPRYQNVTEQDRALLQDVAWDPGELLDLKLMDRQHLLGLMAFCNIRVFNDMPVIACEDEELRGAYLAWRGAQSMEHRAHLLHYASKWRRMVHRAYKHLTDWVDEMT